MIIWVSKKWGELCTTNTSITLGLCNFAGGLEELDADCLNIGILKCNYSLTTITNNNKKKFCIYKNITCVIFEQNKEIF